MEKDTYGYLEEKFFEKKKMQKILLFKFLFYVFNAAVNFGFDLEMINN